MTAIVERDIIRDGKIWVKAGKYPAVRRFDNLRWIIMLGNPRHAGERTITLVASSDIILEI